MCTLVVAAGVFADRPLVVAANRDERLDRPASGPTVRHGALPFIAPKDEVAGGTWLGLNAKGLFVGITNRFGVPVDKRKASRGAIVMDALQQPDVAALHAWMGSFPADRYNPFHLLYADTQEARVSWFDGADFHQSVLGPGVHIVTERSLGGDDRARTERVRAAWHGAPSSENLMALLRLHTTQDPLGSVCVHLPEYGYGTRSSFILELKDRVESSRMWWAEGAPCQVDFVERSELLAALGLNP